MIIIMIYETEAPVFMMRQHLAITTKLSVLSAVKTNVADCPVTLKVKYLAKPEPDANDVLSSPKSSFIIWSDASVEKKK